MRSQEPWSPSSGSNPDLSIYNDVNRSRANSKKEDWSNISKNDSNDTIKVLLSEKETLSPSPRNHIEKAAEFDRKILNISLIQLRPIKAALGSIIKYGEKIGNQIDVTNINRKNFELIR